ncbi:MAG: SMI1/KNR4 family protein [Saprospiraceae bacterium]
MNGIIATLDKNLQEKRPDYYQKLQKGLSEADISKLESSYQLKLPEELSALYAWKNGQQQDCYEAFVNNSMFEPLAVVLDTNQFLNEMIGYDFQIKNWWNEHWLPIFSNGGGSYICYDLKGIFTEQRGQLLEYWKGENDRCILAPNLTDFLGCLNQYYKETAIEQFDEYFSLSAFPSEWRKSFIVEEPIT